MDTKNRIWRGTAVLSVSALMLTACGDGGDDDAPAEETAAEEIEETPATRPRTTPSRERPSPRTRSASCC